MNKKYNDNGKCVEKTVVVKSNYNKNRRKKKKGKTSVKTERNLNGGNAERVNAEFDAQCILVGASLVIGVSTAVISSIPIIPIVVGSVAVYFATKTLFHKSLTESIIENNNKDLERRIRKNSEQRKNRR